MSLGFENDTWVPGDPLDEPEDWHERITEPDWSAVQSTPAAVDPIGDYITGINSGLPAAVAIAQALSTHQETPPRFVEQSAPFQWSDMPRTADQVAARTAASNGILGIPAAARTGVLLDAPAEESRLDRMRAKVLTRDQLRSIPAARYLIKGVLDLNSESWLIGASGGFKSFMAIDWACHVATGTPWWGMRVRKGKVFYVVAEGAQGFAKRVDAWERVNGKTADDLYILPMPVQARSKESFKADVGEDWRTLCKLAAEMGPSLIVLDTQARMTVGLEENSNSELGVWIEAVRLLKEATKACVLVVHHTGRKGGDARGASAIDAAQDMEWKVERDGDKEKRLGTLIHEKSKDGRDDERFPFSAHVVELGRDEDGDPISSLVIRQDDREEGDTATKGVFIIAAHLSALADKLGLPRSTGRDQMRAAVLAKWPDEKHATAVWIEAARLRKSGGGMPDMPDLKPDLNDR